MHNVNLAELEQTIAKTLSRAGSKPNGPTRQNRTAVPGLLGRDFTANAPNVKWRGDIAEIPTRERPS